MIARIWTGATRTQDADAYQQYMREVALPGYADVSPRMIEEATRRCAGRGQFLSLT